MKLDSNLCWAIPVIGGCVEHKPARAVDPAKPRSIEVVAKATLWSFSSDCQIIRDSETGSEFVVVFYRDAIAITPLQR